MPIIAYTIATRIPLEVDAFTSAQAAATFTVRAFPGAKDEAGELATADGLVALLRESDSVDILIGGLVVARIERHRRFDFSAPPVGWLRIPGGSLDEVA